MNAFHMHRAIIVDDEPKLIAILKLKLNRLFPQLDIIDTASNVQEAYSKIITSKPDIVFLDISMPLESGFDLLQKFNQIDFQIIFVTGFNGQILNTLKVSQVDYILKPIDDENLLKTVNLSIEQINTSKKLENYNALKENVNLMGDQNSKIYIPLLEGYTFVRISDIIRCESTDLLTKIYLKSNEEIISSRSINKFARILEPYNFYSPHNLHVINNNELKSYSKNKELLILKDDTAIPLSPRRKVDFISSSIYQSVSK